MNERWGFYGGKPPCEHLISLKDFLVINKVWIWGSGESGHVDVFCSHCSKTYEVELHPEAIMNNEEER